MKWLKYFESLEEIDPTEIFEILRELEEAGHDIWLQSASGHSEKPSQWFSHPSSFRLKRYHNVGSLNFSFHINFTNSKNYHQLVELMDSIKTEIGRLEDIGFSLERMNFEVSEDSDRFNAISIRYQFSS